MKESAMAAMSLIKNHAVKLGIDQKLFDERDVHVHIPAGAIPKDGPSAGVALYTALASLYTRKIVNPKLAMTGEISLRGLVLPVGGVKEKVLGALAAGIEIILLPAKNRADLDDIPKSARDQLEFHFIDHVDQALEVAFADPKKRRAVRKASGRKTSARKTKKKATRKTVTKKKASSSRTAKKKTAKKKTAKKKAAKRRTKK